MTTELRDLELDILASCLGETKATRKVSRALNGYKFSDKSSRWLWKAIKSSYSKHGISPRIKILSVKAQNEISDDELFTDVINLIRGLIKREATSDIDAILPELVTSHSKKKILNTITELIDAAESGDLDQAQELLLKTSKTIKNREERTGSGGVIEIARAALAENPVKDFVPTGLAWVDRRIRGIGKGEVFLMAGITGIGKSVSMIQAGQAALGMKKRVVHYTTEMDRRSIVYRYLSRFTGIPEQRIRERRMSKDEKKLLNAWLDRNEERMNDLLKIEQIMPNSGTIADIESSLSELERDGNSIDLVIIDSPDHLRSIRKYKDWLHESTEVWWGVKAIAEKGYAVWATTQIGRGKWEYKLATPEAVAENYNKARIASAFFSVNWQLDNKSKPNGKRRLFWGKYRSGSSRHVIPLRCDLTRMVMITKPEPEELDYESID